MTYRDVTDEEHEALEAFAASHGWRWKDILVIDYWYKPRLWHGPQPAMGPSLHALRSELGTGWLYQHFQARAGSAADDKPTRIQLDTLEAVRDGKVARVKLGHGILRITGPVNVSVVGRLVALRWAKWPLGPLQAQACELTHRGIRVLSVHRPVPDVMAAE